MARETDEEFRERVRRSEAREPVKFEAGQVVRVKLPERQSASLFLVTDVEARGMVHAVDLHSAKGTAFLGCVYADTAAVLSPAPRRGDTWSNGESVAHLELCSTPDGFQMRILGDGVPFVGGTVAVARRLWEGGYRRENPPLRIRSGEPAPRDIAKGEMIEVEIAVGRNIYAYARGHDGEFCAPRERQVDFDDACRRVAWDLGVSTADATHAISSVCAALPWSSAQVFAAIAADNERVWSALRTHIDGVSVHRQPRIDATTPQSAIDGIRADRATGDDLRDLAELHGVPVLRAGVVVRAETPIPKCHDVGRVTTVGYRVGVKWNWARFEAAYDPAYAEARLRDGTWRVVEPDVRPLASLAAAVATVFTAPDRETSRRYVDLAVRAIRGEPFERAIQAALVGVSDIANLSPAEIAACIAALRHWEARRPFDRDLVSLKVRTNDWVRGGPWNRLQIECNDVLRSALGYAPMWDYDRIYFVYERARTA